MPESMTPEERAEWIGRIRVLSDKLDVSERQRAETERVAVEAHEAAVTATKTARRQKWYTRGLVLLIVVVAFFVNEQREDGEDIAANQVTTCENGNDTRGLQHDFWTYLVTVSAQSPGNQNPVVQEFFADFQHTIDVAFAQRDCTDLTKRYPAPEFPDIPTQKEIKEAE